MTEETLKRANKIQDRIKKINRGLNECNRTTLKRCIRMERNEVQHSSEYYDELEGFTNEAFESLKQSCVANLHKERQELEEEMADL